MSNDTIAAISSGLTESGIGIIRISGPGSYEVADRIFRNKKGGRADLTEPNRVHYGFITNVSRETLDEVLLINMKAPHTYTGEDTIEIDCHGGVLMMKRVLETVLEAGARPAEPGEFTKRAFLSGRIDLSQAEAVIDIINAKNDNAIKASVSQLKGGVSDKISDIRGSILENSAFIEAALDDPEHYSLDGFAEDLREKLDGLISEVSGLIDTFRYGRFMREGINTVIVGKPNAGKSSLLNAMLGEERAIVTQIPGTTRDTITETVSAGNITLNLMDTAGIRKTDDIVESIGVERAVKNLEAADLILWVIDLADTFDASDAEILSKVRDSKAGVLLVFNKTDLEPVITVGDVTERLPEEKRDYLMISAKNEEGIDGLFKRIEEMFEGGDIGFNDEVIISSLRHAELLKSAKKSLQSATDSIAAGMPEDLLTIDLMDAYAALGEILGEEVGEDLINEIFSKFCMGK